MALRDAVKEAHPEPEQGGGEIAYTAPPDDDDPDAADSASHDKFVKFTDMVEHARAHRAARPVHRSRRAASADRRVDEVQPAIDIIRSHFRGAAMSHGALTGASHMTIAAAVNELGHAVATAARAARPAGATTSPNAPGGRSGRRSAQQREAHPEIYTLGGEHREEPLPQPHPAGCQRPVRRRCRVPRQRRRAVDQDGPGCQARRGRAAHGQEGDDRDRRDPLRQARHRPDLARRRTTTSTRSRTWRNSSTT